MVVTGWVFQPCLMFAWKTLEKLIKFLSISSVPTKKPAGEAKSQTTSVNYLSKASE